MNKYYIRTLKEVRTVKEFEIEAETLNEAKDYVYSLDDDNEEGNIVMVDCSDFEILEAYQINN